MTENGNGRVVTHSKDLLDVGNKSSTLDTLLVTRSKPERLPPSAALSRVKSFLPKLQEANQSLQERLASEPAGNLDIENVEGCDGPIIEMNIALENHSGETSESDEIDSSDSSSSSGEDSGDDASGLLDEISADNIKLPSGVTTCKRKNPVIEELSAEQESEKSRLAKDR